MAAHDRIAEVIDGGEPTFPPVIDMTNLGIAMPLMHGGCVVVASATEHAGVALCIAHPGMATGLYMGLSPSEARSAAAWLLSAADEVDGGKGKQ